MIEFYQQETSETCGAAVVRNILYHNHQINEDEKTLVEIIKNHNPSRDVKAKGIGVKDISNIGKYFGLNSFSRRYGNINEIKDLIDKNIWTIIHRPFGINDDFDGHYILSYFYNHYIYLFDPAREVGGIKIESFEEFNKKWNFPRNSKNPEKWFMFFYKDYLKIPFKGKYL